MGFTPKPTCASPRQGDESPLQGSPSKGFQRSLERKVPPQQSSLCLLAQNAFQHRSWLARPPSDSKMPSYSILALRDQQRRCRVHRRKSIASGSISTARHGHQLTPLHLTMPSSPSLFFLLLSQRLLQDREQHKTWETWLLQGQPEGQGPPSHQLDLNLLELDPGDPEVQRGFSRG